MASFESVYWVLPEGIPRRSRERLAALGAEAFPPHTPPAACATWCLNHPHAHDAAITLLRTLHQGGVELMVQRIGTASQTLRVRDPRRMLTLERRQEVHGLEDDLITLLRFGPVSELTAEEFARSASVARFVVDGREILVAADNVDPCHPALVAAQGRRVYTAREILACSFKKIAKDLPQQEVTQQRRVS